MRSLGGPSDSFTSAEGSGPLAKLVSAASGRLTSLLDTGTVASVVGDVVGDVPVELLVYVDESMTTTLGQVSDAISDIVVDG